MNTDKAILCGTNNVSHGNVNLNMANYNFNDFYRRLSTEFVRIVNSDDRLESAPAFTAFPRLILLVNC